MAFEFKPYDFKSTIKDIGESIEKSIIKKAESILTTITNKAQGKSLKIAIPNTYAIGLDIGGIQFTRETGCSINLKELNDLKNQ